MPGKDEIEAIVTVLPPDFEVNRNTGSTRPDWFEIEPFELLEPEDISTAYVFSSPHSGRFYSESFLDMSLLDPVSIRQSEDFLVDELFDCAIDVGAPLLRANYPRAFLDINREPFELDGEMFNGDLPSYVNTRSIRVAGGLGTIPKIVSDKGVIYKRKLDVQDAINRVDLIYKPYHQALRNILARTHVAFGYAVLVDCHSMPSGDGRGGSTSKADFIIGDRYGTSASIELIHAIKRILVDLGYRVSINKPYAGGFITEHYGRPKNGLHALQIEINRSLYMHEDSIAAHAGFGQLSENIRKMVMRLVSMDGMSLCGQFPLAAE